MEGKPVMKAATKGAKKETTESKVAKLDTGFDRAMTAHEAATFLKESEVYRLKLKPVDAPLVLKK